MAGQSRRSNVDVDASGFLADLKEEYRRLRLETEQDLYRLGVGVHRRARNLCPVDTGRLRSSIAYRAGRDSKGPFVDVGTNVSYAAFVEFGTRRQRPQPYLRPALAEAVGALGKRQARGAA